MRDRIFSWRPRRLGESSAAGVDGFAEAARPHGQARKRVETKTTDLIRAALRGMERILAL
jgi:hypothetical protein